MNDKKIIKKFKEKRKVCGYSQARLEKELNINRQNFNGIENGKVKVSREMKRMILDYLDYCRWGSVRKMRIYNVKSIFLAYTNGLQTFYIFNGLCNSLVSNSFKLKVYSHNIFICYHPKGDI
ncbi:MAG: helix-turn-helix domain-containing protein [Clostridium paraputrificum]